ncbi:transposase domain-containing protein [Rhizobium ruizarguesonis]|uniref:Transposase domain-containing protein n=1 Tax=Rhizobium ruizarguesonis TaxID=2081791 RepID=A0AAE8TZ30_9HYPH|nr:transposase domain-containing protein [Rhizobium leguminosarum bv. trifolii]QJS32450.1 transposase domain-containing protein [Rhizobium leguminosarum bv. trifolii TA1]TAT70265.1 transposase domain-containing protein [Rhizobium ruizarguesonis]TAT71279.1 transposase domain-containing protein [Rhizobium ruizarguesonis]TAT73019.1 transposase domain-containing protein [Rhizobium ruizarguesonis]
MYNSIVTTKMNRVDPHAWFPDVLAWIADHRAHRIDALLPLQWKDRTLRPFLYLQTD